MDDFLSDPMVRSKSPTSSQPPGMVPAVFCLLAATGLTALSLQTVLQNSTIATTFVSRGLWQRCATILGGRTTPGPAGQLIADVSLAKLFLLTLAAAGLGWVAGGWAISRRSQQPLLRSLADWGLKGWLWWLVPGVWEALRLTAYLMEFDRLATLLLGTPAMFFSVMLAGWSATFCTLARSADRATLPVETSADDHRVPALIWLTAGLYVIIFTAMNWQLYRGLLVPHGDSAMYEEHLWNVTHGKGFRSYLDDGRLFLGEHIQAIHLLLIPFHLVWPSHLLLEFCESLALAGGAIPVFWLACRHSRSNRVGFLLAVAYLLYFPMQFLDIAVDLKTFRPISFGVPLMLFALDQFERGRFRSMAMLLLLALSAKEDYAAIIAPLGLWMLFTRSEIDFSSSTSLQKKRWWGAAIALFSILYLLIVVKLAIPWFRDGDVHYARYFGELGGSPGEIVAAFFGNPVLVLGKLFSQRSLFYLLVMLVPAGFLPLFSPGRAAVCLPMFAVLCLIELSNDPTKQSSEVLIPFHHFHAPLVPILFWAAASGVANCSRRWNWNWKSGVRSTECGVNSVNSEFRIPNSQLPAPNSATWAAHFVWTSAAATGLFFSFGPFGLGFWDSESSVSWRSRFVPGRRAELFSKVFDLIPIEARVFSTDFVHPRFTHHQRSYDYSAYPRKSDDELQDPEPGAAYYIVIDTRHPYSKIKRPGQVPEYRDHPNEWELLPDVTEGYFIVLRRKQR